MYYNTYNLLSFEYIVRPHRDPYSCPTFNVFNTGRTLLKILSRANNHVKSRGKCKTLINSLLSDFNFL